MWRCNVRERTEGKMARTCGVSEEWTSKRVLKGRVFYRKKGRPRTGWLDNVVLNFVMMGVRGWREEQMTEQAGGELWRTPKPTKDCSADDDDWEIMVMTMMMMAKIHCSSAKCDVLTAVISVDYSFARCRPKTVDSGSVRDVYLKGAIFWKHRIA